MALSAAGSRMNTKIDCCAAHFQAPPWHPKSQHLPETISSVQRSRLEADSAQLHDIDQQRSSIMSKILNLIVSRYFAVAVAGAVFVANNAPTGF
jgi:hypothetical protein